MHENFAACPSVEERFECNCGCCDVCSERNWADYQQDMGDLEGPDVDQQAAEFFEEYQAQLDAMEADLIAAK